MPNQFQKGHTFSNGDVVDGPSLNALIDEATALKGIIFEQTTYAATPTPTELGNDWILYHDVSDAAFPLKKIHPDKIVPGVTSFSADTSLPGVFTTTVDTPSTTPHLNFSMANGSGNKVLASPADGTSGALAMRALAPADMPNGMVAIPALVVDWNLGVTFYKNLTGTINLTFTNMSEGQTIRVRIRNNAGGTANVHWTTGSIFWRGGSEPTLTATANAFDIYVFTNFGGTTVFGYSDKDFS